MRRPDETGMALLVVLLLVAVMSAMAVGLLDDIRFTQRRALNAEAVAQARWYAIGAETLVRAQGARLLASDPSSARAKAWNGRIFRFPVEAGSIQARLSPGADCFNLNSVVQGRGEVLVPRETGGRQFVALAVALGLGKGEAESLAAALTDWIDVDQVRQPGGAEDEAYLQAAKPYRTSGTLLAETSELRAIRGFTEDIYRRLRPHVCALPTTDLSPINLNTLAQANAVLLVMLTEGGVSIDTARRVLAQRPAGGWTSTEAFWAEEGMADAAPGGLLQETAYTQTTLRPRYLKLDTDVAYRDAEVVASALFEIDPAGAPRLAARRWTRDE